MKSLVRKIAVFSIAFFIVGVISQIIPANKHDHKGSVPIFGNSNKLMNAYENWKERATNYGANRKLLLSLSYSKGLSSQFTKARGQFTLDLVEGEADIEIVGLEEDGSYDAWLIDNISGSGKSVIPEPGDEMVKIGTLKFEEGTFKLHTHIDIDNYKNFKLDLVAITQNKLHPVRSGLLFGSPTLFQRLYYSEQRGQFANLGDHFKTNPTTKVFSSSPFNILIPEPASATHQGLDHMIAAGEDLFFNETFGGNGRTCGTCHPMENNLTIDPEFIASRPPNDPLFVAENKKKLEDLENPPLMREFGLILENLDGFENPGVMRGVPHTLALPTSLNQDTTNPFTPPEMTGWSGDGSPGGTLRDFATGAVVQHFPKDLRRRPGIDFDLPTDERLDKMEAFQLSLGRQSDPDLPGGIDENGDGLELDLNDASAEDGCILLMDGNLVITGKGGRCGACHNNAGANNSANQNRNFLTGIEDLLPDPNDMTGEPRPRDGGFGTAPDGSFPAVPIANPEGGFGNRGFNTPPIIEAVDTPPFFHNNVVSGTIEDAIDFYNSDEFNENPLNDPPGPFDGDVGRNDNAEIELSNVEVTDMGKCARVLNALENIRNSKQLLMSSLSQSNFGRAKKQLRVALSDTNDAIEVLDKKGLHPDAVDDLNDAAADIKAASKTPSSSARNTIINDAINSTTSARDDICVAGSDPVLCD